jgi:hypothetical protein
MEAVAVCHKNELSRKEELRAQMNKENQAVLEEQRIQEKLER